MIRTHILPCRLPKDEADALNKESARVYNLVMIWHYRIYRRTGHWLSKNGAQKYTDPLIGKSFLHSHSQDAAQEAFYAACKTALSSHSKYPHRIKEFRTTVWKNTGMRLENGKLFLGSSRGLQRKIIDLPKHLRDLPVRYFVKVSLVWNQSSQRYCWHLTIDDNSKTAKSPGSKIAGVDLGEIHPAVVSDGEIGVVFSARELRSTHQYTNKRLAKLRNIQETLTKHSRRWTRIQKTKSCFLGKQENRIRNIEHKVSRGVVDWAEENEVGILAMGDVRNTSRGKRLNKSNQQKISNWSHGRMQKYITYKAEERGIRVELVSEHYTSQTCPKCGNRHKPKGRKYHCPACGFDGHRDVVGATNIASRFADKTIDFPHITKYRHPYITGKRSRLDTAQVAC